MQEQPKIVWEKIGTKVGTKAGTKAGTKVGTKMNRTVGHIREQEKGVQHYNEILTSSQNHKELDYLLPRRAQ